MKRMLSTNVIGKLSVITSDRGSVGNLKHERDLLRAENVDLKQQSGLIGADDLLRDFEKRLV